MNIQTRYIFTEHNYHFHKRFYLKTSDYISLGQSINKEWEFTFNSFFQDEELRKNIKHIVSELVSNSIDHNKLTTFVQLDLWDSTNSFLLCYWEENTCFYNSKEIKDKLESGIKIPTKKIQGGGAGIPKIINYPRKIHIDTKQKVLFLDIQKPFK